MTYKRGQRILKEGDVGDFLVVLYSGRVNVLRSQGKHQTKEQSNTSTGYIGSHFTGLEDEADEQVLNKNAPVVAVR